MLEKNFKKYTYCKKVNIVRMTAKPGQDQDLNPHGFAT